MSGRVVLPLLGALLFLRLAVAASTGLSPDEAYYWVWSRALAPGYLDHPPMVALLIRAGTALAGENPLGVRLLGPVASFAGSLALVPAARDLLGLSPGRAWVSALLFNATLLVGVGSIVITPDTPVVLFWGLTLACLGRALRTGRGLWVAAAGASLGLAFCSKYTAVLLLPPVLAWLLACKAPRALLGRPASWLGVVAGLAASAPVLAWNAAHGWASFAKQGGRTTVAHWARAPRTLAELVSGQVGLATPLLALLAALGTWQVARRARAGEAGPVLVTLATGVPALVFALHALGDRVQANWPCVLYPSAMLAAAACRPPRRVPGPGPAAALGLAITAVVYGQAVFHLVPLPARLDVTLARLDGWTAWGRAISAADARTGGLPVVSDAYGLAAELAWNRAGGSVGAVAPRWALFRLPALLAPGARVLLVRRAGLDHGAPPPGFASASPAGVITRAAGGVVAERDVLSVATVGAVAPVSASLPPHRGR